MRDCDSEEEIVEAFKVFDKNCSGTISSIKLDLIYLNYSEWFKACNDKSRRKIKWFWNKWNDLWGEIF